MKKNKLSYFIYIQKDLPTFLCICMSFFLKILKKGQLSVNDFEFPDKSCVFLYVRVWVH